MAAITNATAAEDAPAEDVLFAEKRAIQTITREWHTAYRAQRGLTKKGAVNDSKRVFGAGARNGKAH